ncbi:MAG: hypothetical protein BWY99_02518 [Synergistetes bacterium ADurb.BinA166]|nr:MAG: hypothetical protein BWY99_02518 [Synergistetes bacterium ADurb.BinA166]
MQPSQVAQHLRSIAAALDVSKKPSALRVAADIKKILAALENVSMEEQTAAIPKSRPGFEMMKGMLDSASKAFESGDEEGFKKIVNKLNEHASRA